MLKRKGIPHQVLNAKYHEQEAYIVAQAGHYKAVTIATNMAGRGTDILLGGNPDYLAKNIIRQKFNPADPDFAREYENLLVKLREESRQEHEQVVSVGGLHVLGTERHEARRIDNQLRGRSGRQGDPGSSRFYVALGDDLMRLFGSDKIIGMMDKLGLEEGQVIEHPWVSKSIEVAQRRVEQHNFEIRKQLLEYDNVMNKQREVIYTQRRQILEGISLKENVLGIVSRMAEEIVNLYALEGGAWDLPGMLTEIKSAFGLQAQEPDLNTASRDSLKNCLYDKLAAAYQAKEESLGQGEMRVLERMVFLQNIDAKWKDHLYAMDTLREGIGLRAYGQRDPLIEYKREGFAMFSEMIARIESESTELIFKLQPVKEEEKLRGVFSSLSQEMYHPEAGGFENISQGEKEASPEPSRPSAAAPVPQPSQPKAGRNDPCPCGSGKKYKKCCGK
jgi:preprotein translocase subunit SecA